MNLEAALIAVLTAQCPRVFPVVAPYSTPTPYVTWQHVGGKTQRWVDSTPSATRNASVQIDVWADSSYLAFALIRQIEDALCAAPALQVDPQGEPMDTHDEGDTRRGAMQSFSVWGAR
jgi:hypothetical protein